jgi:AbrB family looped-hinge helix DNA binding protein
MKTLQESSYTTNGSASKILTMIVTVKNKSPLVVPPAVRRQAGLRSGDELEFRVSGRVITIRPKVPQATVDEYTPAQRRVIDRGVAKGLEDIRSGRTHGPFTTADAAIAHLQSLARSRKKAARKSP